MHGENAERGRESPFCVQSFLIREFFEYSRIRLQGVDLFRRLGVQQETAGLQTVDKANGSVSKCKGRAQRGDGSPLSAFNPAYSGVFLNTPE